MIVSTPFLLSGHITRLFLEKCLPYAPGFGILEDCLEYTYDKQGVVLTGTYAIVYWAIVCLVVAYLHTTANGFLLALFQLFVVESCCIRFYLKNLLELAMNHSINLTYTTKILKLYKHLQILISYYNQIHQDAFMTAYMCFVGVAIIIPSYALISSWSALGTVQFLILMWIGGEAVFGLIYCFGNFGGIYCDSYELIGALRNPTFFRDRKRKVLHRRVVNSLKPFKIMIGSVNFIDQLTPFSFIEFCFDRVVDLLLL